MQKHILVVEDSDDEGIMLANIIELVMNHKVTLTRDGVEAVRLAGETHFDVVLLDLRLPSLPGLSVVEALRRMEAYLSVPIIAVTAYDWAGVRSRALQSGCNYYVTKPIDVQSFIDLVSGYLTKS
jgi:two-component system cell cycle response regulator DivK